MTVRELIEELSQLDQELEAWRDDIHEYPRPIGSVDVRNANPFETAATPNHLRRRVVVLE